MWFHVPDADAWWRWVILVLFYAVGVLHMVHALMHVRTSQGAIAWVLSLLMVPFVAIPLYWLLGRRRFSREIGGRRAKDSRLAALAVGMMERLRRYEVDIPDDDAFERAARILGGLPFTRGNRLELLIDGEETFDNIFETIRSAKRHLCVNFFIVKSDALGIRF